MLGGEGLSVFGDTAYSGGSASSTTTIYFANGNNQQFTVSADVGFSLPSIASSKGKTLTLAITQNSTGGYLPYFYSETTQFIWEGNTPPNENITHIQKNQTTFYEFRYFDNVIFARILNPRDTGLTLEAVTLNNIRELSFNGRRTVLKRRGVEFDVIDINTATTSATTVFSYPMPTNRACQIIAFISGFNTDGSAHVTGKVIAQFRRVTGGSVTESQAEIVEAAGITASATVDTATNEHYGLIQVTPASVSSIDWVGFVIIVSQDI